jgi:hypothetical protein
MRLRGRVLVRFTLIAKGYFLSAAFLWHAKGQWRGPVCRGEGYYCHAYSSTCALERMRH